jgi:hypothetical protein
MICLEGWVQNKGKWGNGVDVKSRVGIDKPAHNNTGTLYLT